MVSGTSDRHISANTYNEVSAEVVQNNYYSQDSSGDRGKVFEEIENLENYASVIVPLFTKELLDLLERNHMLLLSSTGNFDTYSLSRYLIYTLKKQRAGLREAKEWLRDEEPNIFNAVTREPGDQVLVFDNMQPQHINFAVGRLQDMALENGHFIIITTSVTISKWNLTSSNVWYSIEDPIPYHDTDLQQDLFRRVRDFPQSFYSSPLVANKLQSEHGRLAVIRELGSPDRIQLFVQFLKSFPQIGDHELEEALEYAVNSKYSLVQSIKMLPENRRFIAMGISLLDGLFEDQFFALLQRFIDESWGKRMNDQKAVDYCDLQEEGVAAFLSAVPGETNSFSIRAKYSLQRLEFIRSEWNHYRRHILSCLPVVFSLTKESTSGLQDFADWELFGTRQRRHHFRLIMSEMLSDLGFHDFRQIEPFLLQYAIYPNTVVQRITARALARWRRVDLKGGDKMLFEVLDQWQHSSNVHNAVKKIGDSKEEASAKIASPLHYLRGTIVMTLGYAAAYDDPNELSDEILQILSAFIKDQNKVVQQALAEILPEFLRHHPQKLYNYTSKTGTSFLVILLRRNHLIVPIARGLAKALENYHQSAGMVIRELFDYHCAHDQRLHTQSLVQPIPTEGFLMDLLNTFTRWMKKLSGFSVNLGSNEAVNEHLIAGEFTEEDRVGLMLIFFCHRVILAQGVSTVLYVKSNGEEKKVLELLQDLHRSQNHIEVRRHLLSVLVSLLDEERPEIERLIVENYLDQDQKLLVDQLVKQYFNQRNVQKGGDEEWVFRGRTYSLWVYRARPLLYLEELLMSWLEYENAAQAALAGLALARITRRFDTYEHARIDEVILEAERKEEERTRQEQRTLEEHVKRAIDTMRGKMQWKRLFMKKLLTVGKSPKSRRILKAIDPLVEANEIDKDSLKILIGRFQAGGPAFEEVARVLKSLHDKGADSKDENDRSN